MAENLPAPGPLGVVEVVLAATVVVLVAVLEEPPQAARPRHKSAAISAVAGASSLRMWV